MDGRVRSIEETLIRADDAGFQLGLSVFDTVLYENGCFYFIERHLERLQRGALELSINCPAESEAIRALKMLRDAIGTESMALRMTLTRGPAGAAPTFIITAREISRPADPGAVLAIANDRRIGGDPMGRIKSTNRLLYILAREDAIRRGAFEALFLSHDGDVLEGSISNFFCVVNGELMTPSVERGCLPGTVRGLLLDALEREPVKVDGRELSVRSDCVSEADLALATEIFLTNTTGRVIPVRELLEVDGQSRSLPGSNGPVTRVLRDLVERLEAEYRAAQQKNGI
ncbi:MAG: branched-subunit amino acid aminotransferase/4-amino-4-deoxychorismate lyase [Planctomycetota bacterium]|jgi:branched-subunit amino acid aminotransferase/4-amino-4-deoxychorismate lyase